MMKTRRNLFFLVGLLGSVWCAPSLAATKLHEHPIPRADWPQPPTGDAVLKLRAVRAVLEKFQENGRMQVVIRYPGGDPGQQWADELHEWFVSFGVPIQYLEQTPGVGDKAQLIVVVVDRGGGKRRRKDVFADEQLRAK